MGGVFGSAGAGVIYRSTNSGGSFKLVHTGGEKVVSIARDGKAALAVSFDGSIHISKDGGEKWSTYKDPCWAKGVDFGAVAVHGKLMLVVGQIYVCRSDDGGGTWATKALMPKPAATPHLYGAAIARNKKTAQTVALVVGGMAKPGNPKPHWVFRSVDGGKTWKDIKGDLSSKEMSPFNEVRMLDDGHAVIVGANGVLYWSQDWGLSWSSKKLGSNEFNALDMSSSGLVLVASKYSPNVYLSKDSGYLFLKAPYTSSTMNQHKTSVALDGNGTAYIGSNSKKDTLVRAY